MEVGSDGVMVGGMRGSDDGCVNWKIGLGY